MPSLGQIPVDLLDITKHDEFIDWCFKFNLSWYFLREYVRIWSFETEYEMTAAEWSRLEDRWIKQHAQH